MRGVLLRGALGEGGHPFFVLLDVPLRAYLPADPKEKAPISGGFDVIYWSTATA